MKRSTRSRRKDVRVGFRGKFFPDTEESGEEKTYRKAYGGIPVEEIKREFFGDNDTGYRQETLREWASRTRQDHFYRIHEVDYDKKPEKERERDNSRYSHFVTPFDMKVQGYIKKLNAKTPKKLPLSKENSPIHLMYHFKKKIPRTQKMKQTNKLAKNVLPEDILSRLISREESIHLGAYVKRLKRLGISVVKPRKRLE